MPIWVSLVCFKEWGKYAGCILQTFHALQSLSHKLSQTSFIWMQNTRLHSHLLSKRNEIIIGINYSKCGLKMIISTLCICWETDLIFCRLYLWLTFGLDSPPEVLSPREVQSPHFTRCVHSPLFSEQFIHFFYDQDIRRKFGPCEDIYKKHVYK